MPVGSRVRAVTNGYEPDPRPGEEPKDLLFSSAFRVIVG